MLKKKFRGISILKLFFRETSIVAFREKSIGHCIVTRTNDLRIATKQWVYFVLENGLSQRWCRYILRGIIVCCVGLC